MSLVFDNAGPEERENLRKVGGSKPYWELV